MKSLAIYCTTEEDQDVLERVELVDDSNKKQIIEDDIVASPVKVVFFDIKTDLEARAKELVDAGKELLKEAELGKKIRRIQTIKE